MIETEFEKVVSIVRAAVFTGSLAATPVPVPGAKSGARL